MGNDEHSFWTRFWGLAVASLSGRLFLLTLIFVLVSEVLTFSPAIGRYHRTLLENHILSAELAVMPFNEPGSGPGRRPGSDLPMMSVEGDARPEASAMQALKRSMLSHANAIAVSVKRSDFRNYYSIGQLPRFSDEDISRREHTIDLSRTALTFDTYNGLECLLFGGGRVLYVSAPTHIPGAQEIGVFLDEAPIRAELLQFTKRIVANGLFVSAFTAFLVFASLFLFLVRPMQRIIQSMSAFRQNPEDASRILVPSRHVGEIGQAERELAAMQHDLFGFLRQKTRLAALGTAVARIQHDLRNILATAQLASDRLAMSEDPAVKRLSPSLVTAIDRAVNLATHTLKFVRAEENPPERSRFPLLRLVAEAADSALGAGLANRPQLRLQIPDEVTVNADREQMFRVLLNLLRNAGQAVAEQSDGVLVVSARPAKHALEIDIADNGTGIPEKALSNLFQPFGSKSRTGGTGLGLAIARELVRGHGGDLVLRSTGPTGTLFRITLPEE